MSEFTVYLAGPVRFDDDGGKSWREEIKEKYEDDEAVEFKDPLDKYNIRVEDLEVVSGSESGESEVSVAEIVHGDKEMIDECNALFVGYSPVRSIGTPMEVMYAYERDYPIGIWLRDSELNVEDLSPWYRYHTDAVKQRYEDVLYSLDRIRQNRE
jgi:hypothetical protein